jgi:hypothetical protein
MQDKENALKIKNIINIAFIAKKWEYTKCKSAFLLRQAQDSQTYS